MNRRLVPLKNYLFEVFTDLQARRSIDLSAPAEVIVAKLVAEFSKDVARDAKEIALEFLAFAARRGAERIATTVVTGEGGLLDQLFGARGRRR